jgi:hypothetical protein
MGTNRLCLLLTLLLSAGAAAADQGPPVYTAIGVVPLVGGVCSGPRVQIEATSGKQWCCNTSKWAGCDVGGGGGGGGYSTVQDEGAALPAQTTLNFAGAGVTCANGASKTTCTIPLVVPAGGAGDVQFNAGLGFGASSNLSFAGSTLTVGPGGFQTGPTGNITFSGYVNPPTYGHEIDIGAVNGAGAYNWLRFKDWAGVTWIGFGQQFAYGSYRNALTLHSGNVVILDTGDITAAYTIKSNRGAGSDAFAIGVDGARLHLGTGTTDYLYSLGTTLGIRTPGVLTADAGFVSTAGAYTALQFYTNASMGAHNYNVYDGGSGGKVSFYDSTNTSANALSQNSTATTLTWGGGTFNSTVIEAGATGPGTYSLRLGTNTRLNFSGNSLGNEYLTSTAGTGISTPSTITAAGFSGPLTGNASTATALSTTGAAGTFWANNNTWQTPAGGGGAPTTATYWTATSEAGLSAEVNLGALTTGLLKHTVTAGVSAPATAAAGTDYGPPTSGNTTGLVYSTTGTGAHTTYAGVTCTLPNVMTALGATGSATCAQPTNVSGTAASMTGNYVASVATTAPLTGGAAGSTGAALTLAVSDATTLAKGVVQLAGDLAGTAALPTVPGLAGKEPTITTLPQTKGGTGAGALTCTGGQHLTSNGTVYSCSADTTYTLLAASTTLGGVKQAAGCAAGNHVSSIGAGGELTCTADSGGALAAATATVLGGVKGNGTTTACTGTDKMTGWDAAGAMTCAADAGAGGAPNYVEVDVTFAALGDNIVTTVVTGQAWVTATSKITCSPTMLATSTKAEGEEDAVIERLSAAIHTRVAGTGFSLTVMPAEGDASGVFKFHCVGG